MHFFVNPIDEVVAQSVRDRLTAGGETMKHLLLGLLDSKGRVAEEIHSIRKLGKSLRGGLSLFRLEKSAALEIQAIGRLLSGPRDAVSRINTWNKLAWAGDPGISSAILGLLENQTHSAARRPAPQTIDWCLVRVDAAIREVQNLPVDVLPGRLTTGLKKLEKRALKSCRSLTPRKPEAFHDARKALKACIGAADYLPQGWISINPAYTELVETLGDENDIATLSHWLESHGFTARFAPDLWKFLKKSRRHLQRNIVHMIALPPIQEDFTAEPS